MFPNFVCNIVMLLKLTHKTSLFSSPKIYKLKKREWEEKKSTTGNNLIERDRNDGRKQLSRETHTNFFQIKFPSSVIHSSILLFFASFVTIFYFVDGENRENWCQTWFWTEATHELWLFNPIRMLDKWRIDFDFATEIINHL